MICRFSLLLLSHHTLNSSLTLLLLCLEGITVFQTLSGKTASILPVQQMMPPQNFPLNYSDSLCGLYMD